MCDNKNDLQKSEYDESVDYTSTRLDLDITETTDSYPEFDFLDLLRSLQVKEKKGKHKNKSNSEVSSNKSNLFSDEDSEVEALAKIYEEKYGTCNDYAELGEGYDEEDSFIDNSDAVNDLVPSGIQTEFGGFYINRGKLNFVKEDNSSSSTSEDADKFLAHNRLNTRKIISDAESDEKESCKAQSNNQKSSNVANSSNIHNSNNIINSTSNNIINNIINNNFNNNNNNTSNNNSNCNNNYKSNFINSNSSNNHHSNNNTSSLQNNIIKSRKKSGEFQHKNKKIRKTATPKIPDHLLYKKPFSGSLEYRKNINEFKKNRLKTVESDKKSAVTNSAVNSSTVNDSDNSNRSNNTKTVISCSSNNNNNSSSSNNNNNNNNNNNSSSSGGNNNNNNNINNNTNSNVNSEEDNEHEKKESPIAKKKPLTVKELLKERDGASEVIEAVALGQQENEDKQESSSSSETSETSSSDSESESSEDTSTEKGKTPQKSVEEPPKNAAVNGSMLKDITAKSFAHLSDSLKELIAKVFEISKKEKNKLFNSRLNSLLLSLDDKLRELPMAERNAVLDHLAEILQMKKDNITKRTKKLLVLQEETKMSGPLRKLKEAVANMMPLLESNYFNEYTKAAGTSPQIYAELSRYYWSIDPCSLPQRKFPWNDELRQYLREIVQYRKNCYYIIRPRKESLIDYIRSFMETKVRSFWPKEWMTVDILLEEAQVTTSRQLEDKQKAVPNLAGTQSPSNVAQKKVSPTVPTQNVSCRKPTSSTTITSTATSPTISRKSLPSGAKNTEVKSILIPRKTPQGSNSANTPTKSNFSTSPSSGTSIPNIHQGSRLQVTLNRLNVQEYFDRMSVSQHSVSRTPSQQISPNRSQQSVSPNRLVKTSSPNPVINSVSIRSNVSQKNSSSCNVNKSMSSGVRNCSTAQSVLKTIGMHSNAVPKPSSNSVTITPVHDSMYKDISPSSEVLNLTKNSSVYVSKMKESSEPKNMTSSSSIGIPLPSGITISPTNATPSTFLAKPQKQGERNPDVKSSVSITKQESGISLTKDKREPVLNMNLKREGPLQNIPDCISVTSKVVSNERPKYEHVRKRALHEYHLQQHSPEKLKPEEKKMKMEDNLLADIEIKDEKLDDKNFSKIFDSVIAKTSETVRQSESTSLIKPDKFSGLNIDPGTCGGSVTVKNPSSGVSQFKSYPTKLRDVRTPKEKQYYPGVSGSSEEKSYEDPEDRSEPTREQRVQMEMDRVMQNLVELSKEKNAEYEMNYHSPPSAPSGLKSSSFQEVFQKMLFK